MVKSLSILWILVTLFLAGSAQAQIKVTADADGINFPENAPIKILVTITHSPQEAIDEKSFKLGGKPIVAKLIDQTKMTAGNLQLSMYNFELPPQLKGLHLVPEVQVVIAGQTFRTVPTTFEVKSGGVTNSKSPTTPSPNTGKGKYKPNITPMLKFEGFVDGPKILYPGQKTLVGYTYTYNVNLETTAEQTPLLEAQGLLKVGDKIVQEDEKNGISTLKFIQIVKGDQPGDFTYGPSTLEAVPYQLNPTGERAYGDKISSKTPAITIKVIPYPAAEKPPSFNGAIGDFNWKTTLTSSPSVSVGDELSISFDAAGKGDWDTVNLPELCCQPSISGQFRLSDLPAVGKLNGDSKHFEMQLRPLSTAITEIPSLEFSSLNPDTGKYRVVKTEPIPIKVEGGALKPDAIIPKPETESSKLQSREEFQTVQPLEIPGNRTFTSADLRNLPFGNWWVLFLIPLGIGLLIFQFNWINFLDKKKAVAESSGQKSEAILKQALESPLGSSLQYDLLNQALVTRLVEAGELESDRVNSQLLKSTGIQGEVRKFMSDIEALRYAGKQEKSDEEIVKRAHLIFDKISEGNE
ncbi:MAG: BatD family protein [Parachlamydiaceae bacterium]|nr:BatD family protein [Parachlamydiaceae bacterium]